MSKYFPIEDDGLDIAIVPAVPSNRHHWVVMMLMGQVGRMANLLTWADVLGMNPKYVKVLLAAKTLGPRSSARLGDTFDLTLSEVISLVDQLVVEPNLPEGAQYRGTKEELNLAVSYSYAVSRNEVVPLVPLDVMRIVQAIL